MPTAHCLRRQSGLDSRVAALVVAIDEVDVLPHGVFFFERIHCSIEVGGVVTKPRLDVSTALVAQKVPALVFSPGVDRDEEEEDKQDLPTRARGVCRAEYARVWGGAN